MKRSKKAGIVLDLQSLISQENTKWLSKYSAPEHRLNLNFNDLGHEHIYPQMTLLNADATTVELSDMNASEILLIRCFNNIPKAYVPIAIAASEHPELPSRTELPGPSPEYTLNNCIECCIECICHRLFYLGLFYALIHRYDLYIEIEFDGNGEFKIGNKVNPADKTTPEKDRGEAWVLQQARYEEISNALEIIYYCNSAIRANMSLEKYREDLEGLPGINGLVERLNKSVSVVENAYGYERGISSGVYNWPMSLSNMEVNDTLAKELKSGNITQFQPTMNSRAENQQYYDTEHLLRCFESGERDILPGDQLASKSTQNNPGDQPGSQSGSTHSSVLQDPQEERYH